MGILSQLDVVNDMLGLLGETPVNTLTDGHPLVIAGLSRLVTANAREQGRGWWFNTETRTLPNTADGSVYLPDDLLKIDPTDTSLPYVQRGNRLYNTNPGLLSPYYIGANVTCTLVLLVPFEDLPAPAQLAVSYGAQLDFCVHMDGDQDKIGRLVQAYKDALIELRAEHSRAVDANMLRSPSILATIGQIMPTRRYW